MLIFGHRGSSASQPENSLAAFRRAIADGADGVELDVRATADGVLIVLHDQDLARTTTGRGAVDALPLAEVRRAITTDGEPVPTLAEVLDLLGDWLPLDIEVKQGGIERELLGLLARYPRADWVLSSFEWGSLRAVRAVTPSARLWPLATAADEALFAVAEELAAEAVALLAKMITAEVMARCRRSGLRVMAWTVDDPVEARRLALLGVDVVCTNAPAAIRVALAAPSHSAG